VYACPIMVLDRYKILDAQPYYYLQWLLERNPEIVLDVGCGTNRFRSIWPQIIGIDDYSVEEGPLDPPIDPDSICMHFDEDFAVCHEKMCDALISVNAIHHSPLWGLAPQLKALSGMIRPGGRAFVSFNIETWLMHTPGHELQQRFGSFPQLNDILSYMNDQIMSIGLQFLIYDWPVLDTNDCSSVRDDLDGNVRMVFEVGNQIP
jgi:hypothetical protein